jgi:hypothetical protein
MRLTAHEFVAARCRFEDVRNALPAGGDEVREFAVSAIVDRE